MRTCPVFFFASFVVVFTFGFTGCVPGDDDAGNGEEAIIIDPDSESDQNGDDDLSDLTDPGDVGDPSDPGDEEEATPSYGPKFPGPCAIYRHNNTTDVEKAVTEEPDGVTSFGYKGGKLVVEKRSENSVVVIYYEYDDEGRLLREVYDEDDDGEFNYQAAYVYDEDTGRLWRKVWDWGADGDADKLEEWTYSDGGRKAHVVIDEDLDQQADLQKWQEFDASGNLLLDEWDRSMDGKVDWREQFWYRSDGLKKEWAQYEDIGYGDDLSLVRHEEWFYDEHGNVLYDIDTTSLIDTYHYLDVYDYECWKQ